MVPAHLKHANMVRYNVKNSEIKLRACDCKFINHVKISLIFPGSIGPGGAGVGLSTGVGPASGIATVGTGGGLGPGGANTGSLGGLGTGMGLGSGISLGPGVAATGTGPGGLVYGPGGTGTGRPETGPGGNNIFVIILENRLL